MWDSRKQLIILFIILVALYGVLHVGRSHLAYYRFQYVWHEESRYLSRVSRSIKVVSIGLLFVYTIFVKFDGLFQ